MWLIFDHPLWPIIRITRGGTGRCIANATAVLRSGEVVFEPHREDYAWTIWKTAHCFFIRIILRRSNPVGTSNHTTGIAVILPYILLLLLHCNTYNIVWNVHNILTYNSYDVGNSYSYCCPQQHYNTSLNSAFFKMHYSYTMVLILIFYTSTYVSNSVSTWCRLSPHFVFFFLNYAHEK